MERDSTIMLFHQHTGKMSKQTAETGIRPAWIQPHSKGRCHNSAHVLPAAKRAASTPINMVKSVFCDSRLYLFTAVSLKLGFDRAHFHRGLTSFAKMAAEWPSACLAVVTTAATPSDKARSRSHQLGDEDGHKKVPVTSFVI